jgi:hypothetical protein
MSSARRQQRLLHAYAVALLLVTVSALALVSVQQQLRGEVLESPEVDAIERNALNVIDAKEQQDTPPERWADPDPWVVDSDDFSNDFKGDGGELSEFFSEDPKVCLACLYLMCCASQSAAAAAAAA